MIRREPQPRMTTPIAIGGEFHESPLKIINLDE